MTKYLINSTNTYRVSTMADVLALREELEQTCGELTAFNYTIKYIKAKGEVIEEYYEVKAKITFTDIKEPENKVQVEYTED